MPNIFEAKITARNIRRVWEADENREPYLGEVFFPATSQLGLELNLIKGKQGLPVALVSANWDTDVLYRDRIGFESLQAELPFFKEAYKISEKLRQQILTVQDQYRGAYFTEIFNDVADLIDGADVTVERMRMQLIGTGTVSIQENGVDKQYDYGFDTEKQLATEKTLWSASDATPYKSFMARLKNHKKVTKKTPKYVVMNTDVFDALAQDKDITDYFAKLATPVLYPSDKDIKNFLERTAQVTIFVNDKEYVKARDKSKTPVPFYPQDRYTILSSIDLGETVYGTTPEAIDLLNGESNILSGEVLGEGVTLTVWKETDPVCVNTKVSEVVAPSCPAIDTITIVKVF